MTDHEIAMGEPLLPGVPDFPDALGKLGGNLAIRCASYTNGHACVTLTRVDTMNHRIITENLGCVHLPTATRKGLLIALRDAVAEALLDLDYDSMHAP